MPAFLTHCVFAEQVLASLKTDKLKDIIHGNMPVYYLGAQGPDIFFFYKAKPWSKYDGIERLGLLMHDNKTAGFFEGSFNYIKDLGKDTHSQQMLKSYLFGYFCHFCLDSTTHPFIHYFAGIEDRSGKDRKYLNYHKKIESILDAYMFSMIKGMPASRFKASSLIDMDNNDKNILSEYYIYTIKKVYGIKISPEQSSRALDEIVSILDLLYDPYHLKYFFYRMFELVFGQKGDITYFITPRTIQGELDFLNLQKKRWYHPCDHDKSYNSSFLDLYKKAKSKAVRMIEETYDIFSKDDNQAEIKEMFNDLSYSTGLDCGTHKDLKYFHSIFDDHK